MPCRSSGKSAYTCTLKEDLSDYRDGGNFSFNIVYSNLKVDPLTFGPYNVSLRTYSPAVERLNIAKLLDYTNFSIQATVRDAAAGVEGSSPEDGLARLVIIHPQKGEVSFSSSEPQVSGERLVYTWTNENDPALFNRSDVQLSKAEPLQYAKWKGDDAAADFVHHLEEILHHAPGHEDPVVTVILDGENAWEYYPYNAYYFLSELYGKLEKHPDIRTTTFHECVQNLGDPKFHVTPSRLQQMVAGSWVYGTFSTWIGSPDKNRGWDLLCEAKRSYDIVMASGRLDAEEMRLATVQLADCEGSDCFWWFGDYNSAMSVATFDHLFRRNLSNLYRLLKLPAPMELQHVISIGTGDPAMGGAMRRSDGL